MSAALLSAYIFTSTGIFERNNETINVFSASETANKKIVIIDAGHGGLDGGATAYDNVPEKKYNLELAQKLKAFFEAAGYETAMTREDDGDTDGVEGFHKMKDLLNRIELTKKYADCIYISIHLNLSTSSSDKGFQVFYGWNNPSSRNLAESIHSAVETSGLCNRVREVKKSPSSVYLQKNIDVPTVLVECGFLSNSDDYTLLKNSEYQEKLMFALFCGIVDWM